jgi:hypothetical protein
MLAEARGRGKRCPPEDEIVPLRHAGLDPASTLAFDDIDPNKVDRNKFAVTVLPHGVFPSAKML